MAVRVRTTAIKTKRTHHWSGILSIEWTFPRCRCQSRPPHPGPTAPLPTPVTCCQRPSPPPVTLSPRQQLRWHRSGGQPPAVAPAAVDVGFLLGVSCFFHHPPPHPTPSPPSPRSFFSCFLFLMSYWVCFKDMVVFYCVMFGVFWFFFSCWFLGCCQSSLGRVWCGEGVSGGVGGCCLTAFSYQFFSSFPPPPPPPEPVLSQDSLLCHCVMWVTVPYTLYKMDCMCSSGVLHIFTSPWDGEKQSTVSVFAASCMDEHGDASPFCISTRSVLKFLAKLCAHRAQLSWPSWAPSH